MLLTGGGRPAHKDAGYWLQPTVFSGVQAHHTIWRQEIFGPVLAATTFRSEEEALQLANDHEFGLGAAVISADMEVHHCLQAPTLHSLSIFGRLSEIGPALHAINHMRRAMF